MVNTFIAVGAGADDFGFECGDARVEFGDRIGIEILLYRKGKRVAGTRGWRDVVGIHGAMVKDRGAAVNLFGRSKG